MGAWGAIIMSFFGAVFAAMTMRIQLHCPWALLILPFLLFGAMAGASIMVIRRPGEGMSTSKQAERVIMWSTMAEGAGLFIAANLVANLGHPEMLLPAMALVVGLHFLPMAYAIPFRPFYALGAALLGAAALGFVLDPPRGGEISGFAAAGALWIAALLAILRDMKAKSAGIPLSPVAGS
jgi:Na+/H+ antiporter NhaD/arsenite permease-like protein